MITVLVADDHPVMRHGLTALLGSLDGITVVASAADGRGAVKEAVLHRPDVVLLDLQMPGADGFWVLRELGRLLPRTAVCVLTMFGDDDSLFAAMRAGAKGYLLKGAEQEDIERAVRAVAAGEAVFGTGVAPRVLAQLVAPPRLSAPFPELTPREADVLELLAGGSVAPRDRGPAGTGHQDGQQPGLEHPGEAGGRRPPPGGRAGPPVGSRRLLNSAREAAVDESPRTAVASRRRPRGGARTDVIRKVDRVSPPEICPEGCSQGWSTVHSSVWWSQCRCGHLAGERGVGKLADAVQQFCELLRQAVGEVAPAGDRGPALQGGDGRRRGIGCRGER